MSGVERMWDGEESLAREDKQPQLCSHHCQAQGLNPALGG